MKLTNQDYLDWCERAKVDSMLPETLAAFRSAVAAEEIDRQNREKFNQDKKNYVDLCVYFGIKPLNVSYEEKALLNGLLERLLKDIKIFEDKLVCQRNEKRYPDRDWWDL